MLREWTAAQGGRQVSQAALPNNSYLDKVKAIASIRDRQSAFNKGNAS
jgi:hypothetical protein